MDPGERERERHLHILEIGKYHAMIGREPESVLSCGHDSTLTTKDDQPDEDSQPHPLDRQGGSLFRYQ
jgi:hypothetical protein